jgi:MGT family glycosyltransferase
MGKHIAFVNIPAIGHVYPTLGVAAELVRRGHRVTYSSVGRRTAAIESTGATPLPYESTRPSDTDREVRAPGRTTYLTASLLGFLAEAETVLPQIEPALRADPPDLVVFDRMAFAGRILADKLGLPTVQSWVVMVSNEHWSLGSLLDGFDVEDPDFVAFVNRLDAFLGEQGLSLTPTEFLTPVACRDLAYFPRAFQYAGDRFDDQVCFVGPCARPPLPGPSWRPPADGRPVVLVTLGTIYNRDVDFYRHCVAAFADSAWHAVIAVGERTDPAEIGPTPSNVEVHQLVPQLDILEHAGMFVSHAGMGGVMESLRAGIPVVAVPQTLEQEANASRIEELALGARIPPAEVTPQALRDTVDRLAKDDSVARGVARMRQHILDSGGAPLAADAVEACLR